MAETRRATAVLISGRGSNLAALIAAAQPSDYPARIVLVIANRPEALGLEHARRNGIAAVVVDERGFATRAEFEAELDRTLRAHSAEIVCLAGFMRVLSAGFVEAWGDRILNIHPSLLPAFPGLRTHERALAAGVRIHGATVHVVRAAMDDGPIIAQAAVPVSADDTPESLAERVLRAEHRLYALALRLWAGGAGRDMDLVGTDRAAEGAALFSPPG